MAPVQSYLPTPPRQSLKHWLQPTDAWAAIIGLILIGVGGAIVGAGNVSRFAYVGASTAIGIFFYQKYPTFYVSLAWWLNFMSPFAARMVDFKSGWDEQRIMLLAGFLVPLVSTLTFIHKLPNSKVLGGTGFLLPIISLVYASLVGFINRPLFEVARGLLDWLTPILFGFYILVNWRHYPELRQTTQRTFMWGGLIMGSYGIYQYVVAPEWDKFWLNSSGMFTSAGNPAPFEMRVWSTMHSQGPFAVTMMAVLLILLSCSGPLLIPTSAVGYLSFLLTLVRSSWGAWVVGLITYFPALKPKLQMRLIATIVVLSLCVLPLATMEPFAERIGNRLDTIVNIQEDGSFNDRKEYTEHMIEVALGELLGQGLSNSGVDSGIIEFLLLFGWLGTIPYLIGILGVVFKISKIPEVKSDPFISACRAICSGMAAQIVFGAPFKGMGGMLFWAFAGMALAADKYYRHQSILSTRQQINISEINF